MSARPPAGTPRGGQHTQPGSQHTQADRTLLATTGAAVIYPSQQQWRDRGGGVRTLPLVTRAHGAKVFINGITAFDAGAAVPLHSHNCEESVVILEGNALVEVDGREFELGQHDTTFFPANVPHRFRNASDRAPMRILWTYASVDATRTLLSTGDTRRIDDEHRATGGGDDSLGK